MKIKTNVTIDSNITVHYTVTINRNEKQGDFYDEFR